MINKYECVRCKSKKLYPNYEDDKIKGYKCFVCNKVNYPVRDKLE